VYIHLNNPNSAAEVRPRPEPSTSGIPPKSLTFGDGTTIDPKRPYADVTRTLDRLLVGLSASRRSTSELPIDTSSASAVSKITSSARLNEARTSYGRVELSFGDSTSFATVRGVYAGTGTAAAATSLKLELTESTTIGGNSSPLKFRVVDQNGTLLFNYDGSTRAGDFISLGSDIGLAVAFSGGTLIAGSLAETTVNARTPTVVNLDAVFNAENVNARPRFGNAGQVTEGSFLINGTRVEVRADDTVRTVLERINQLVPDIAASSEDEKLLLTTRRPSGREIVLSDDTSGFLAATKLAGGINVRGHVRGPNELLADSKAFAGVTSGNFSIAGRSVSVDPRTDTMATVLARMNSVGAGVVAYYDRETRGLVIRAPRAEDAEDDTSAVVFEDDTSGFLAAMGISTGPQAAARTPIRLAPGQAAQLERLLPGQLAALLAEASVIREPVTKLTAAVAKKAENAYARASSQVIPDNERDAPVILRDEPSGRASFGANVLSTPQSSTRSTTTSPSRLKFPAM
jgi:hypothetical protein